MKLLLIMSLMTSSIISFAQNTSYDEGLDRLGLTDADFVEITSTDKSRILSSLQEYGDNIRFEGRKRELPIPDYQSGELRINLERIYTLNEMLDDYFEEKEEGYESNLEIFCTSENVTRFGRICHIEMTQVSFTEKLHCSSQGMTKETAKRVVPFILGSIPKLNFPGEEKLHKITTQSVKSSYTVERDFISGELIPGWKEKKKKECGKNK